MHVKNRALELVASIKSKFYIKQKNSAIKFRIKCIFRTRSKVFVITILEVLKHVAKLLISCHLILPLVLQIHFGIFLGAVVKNITFCSLTGLKNIISGLHDFLFN